VNEENVLVHSALSTWSLDGTMNAPSTSHILSAVGNAASCVQTKQSPFSFTQPTDSNTAQLEMWANAQRDGRPAEYRWHPLFNAAKFGWRLLLKCRAVTR